MLEWARQRSRVPLGDLFDKFPGLGEWMAGNSAPTLKQLESYAGATHTPVGRLLLAEPPEENLPIPDFRTLGDDEISQPSADLLDTIHLCQQRQEWYRDFARANKLPTVEFVGSITSSTPASQAAGAMTDLLDFDASARTSIPTWTATLNSLAERAENVGALVMINGIVGSNTSRKLNPSEFRGFAISDRLAPLAFVNGADTKAAQIFTLAHELAHLLLGEAALDDANPSSQSSNDIERWCSHVAAEFLVPLEDLRSRFVPSSELTSELERLARVFKVSTLVILRRVYDSGALSWEAFRNAYRDELARVLSLASERTSTGGDFYNTTLVRTSKRFARAIIASTLEGQTLYRDAARLLGFKNLKTLDRLGERLGVA